MKKKWVVLLVIISICIVSYGLYVSLSKGNGKNTLSTANFTVPQLSFQNSLPVGTTVNLPKLTSIYGRTVPNNKKRIFIFVSRDCGSCEYISIAIPKLAKEYDNLTWIYVEKSDEQPIIGNPKINNLYITRDSKTDLSAIFKSKYTPTIFFVDKNNKIIWKRRGFITPDYYTLKNILSAFQKNDYSLLRETYQRNIVIGKRFPNITAFAYPDNKKITFPDNFVGKPTMIFVFQYSCKACLNAMSAIPDNLKQSDKINKIIIFSPFSKKLSEESINFGKEFGFREMVEDLQHPIIKVMWKNVNETFINSKNTTYINDYNFTFQNSIGLVGSPMLIVLDKNGFLKGIFSPNATKAELNKFFIHLYGTLINN